MPSLDTATNMFPAAVMDCQALSAVGASINHVAPSSVEYMTRLVPPNAVTKKTPFLYAMADHELAAAAATAVHDAPLFVDLITLFVPSFATATNTPFQLLS